MSINIKKYVDITSGVGAGAAVKERELLLRLFTTNTLVPQGTIIEMTQLSDVGTLFGTTSEEYKRAAKYFGFVSKIITKAKKICFAPYSASATAAVPPAITGGTALQTIATWKAITTGSLRINLGGADYQISGLDFSTAVALADVATKIQTALNASTSPASTFTVTYDSTAQKFNASFVGSVPPKAIAVITPTVGVNIADNLGWTVAKGMVTNQGSPAKGLVDYVIQADEISDNYGSISFIGTVTQSDYVAVAAWNNAQNVKYQLMIPTTKANYLNDYAVFSSYSGTALTIVADVNTEHDEDIPAIILGATDYNLRNASQNYMFQQVAGYTPKIDSNTEANAIDTSTRVNYYGRTKNAGQPIDFYQNGYLCGVSTAPLQMNVYANEQWFKSAATSQLMSLMLNLPIIPATAEGRGIVLAGLQSVITRAEFNGTIKAEKDLNVDQKAYIYQITGDPLAWFQVQSIGYWLDADVISEAQANGTIKYIIDYTLVYSKADAVNKITGRDILI